MVPTVAELGLDRLSIEDRLEVARAIEDNVMQEIESSPLPQWQMDEIERRLAERQDTPLQGTAWEVVLARSLARARE